MSTRFSLTALLRIFCIGLVSVAPATQAADSMSYPNKPVRIIVPFSAGGGLDNMVRAIAAPLSEIWKQPIIIDNRPGAGSLVGASMTAEAKPDGYTLMATVNQTLVANRFLFKSLPYDPDKSFVPITMLVKSDQMVLANATVPVNNLKELVALAHKRGNLNYGSYGAGSGPDLAFAILNAREGLNVLHVPYKGMAPLLVALAGNEVQFSVGSAYVAKPLADAGKIKPLAIAGKERSPLYPDVLTTTEQGYPYLQQTIWHALFAPAGTPKPILDKIERDIRTVLQDPSFVSKSVTPQGLQAVASTPAALRSAINEEIGVVQEMVRAAKIQPE